MKVCMSTLSRAHFWRHLGDVMEKFSLSFYPKPWSFTKNILYGPNRVSQIHFHSPSEFIGYDTNTEGAHHSTHAKDGHRQAPHDGARARFDGLPVALHPRVVEKGS